jgi:transposase
LPDLGKKIAYNANREGGAERFDDGAVQKTIEVDLALITYDDELLKDLERYIFKTAKQHDAHTLCLLQTVPGIGKILSLVLLDEIHDIRRFPSVQNFASYARLVKCSKESGGKRLLDVMGLYQVPAINMSREELQRELRQDVHRG